MKLKDITFSNPRIINVDGGNVRHVIKNSDNNFKGFGEAYFSDINPGSIKAWKCHSKMNMNLVVPVGRVKFVFYDDSSSSFLEREIGDQNYSIISVPPGIWFGFMGLGSSRSVILNIADIIHDPSEVTRLDKNKIEYNWS